MHATWWVLCSHALPYMGRSEYSNAGEGAWAFYVKISIDETSSEDKISQPDVGERPSPTIHVRFTNTFFKKNGRI